MDILHPAVRSMLKYLGIDGGVEIHHTGDLPSRSGLGSSSSFTVGLLNALAALQGKSFNKPGLALEAVHIERDIMKENVGIQDQIAAAYGGFNHTIIGQDGSFKINPLVSTRKDSLQDHLLLFFTGVSRTASDIAKDVIANTDKKSVELRKMQEMVSEAIKILGTECDICDFGGLLHESWQIKRTLSPAISPGFVDDIYALGRKAGAIGGKLLGAGGGGFMLFFARPEDHDKIRSELKDLLWVPFKFENEGSKIIFSEPNSYSRESLVRRNYSHDL